MTIKDYLNQIGYYREYIRQLRTRKENIHIDYNGISAIDYGGDRVQSSPVNRIEEEGWKLLERLQKIDAEIERVSILIDDISMEIHEVDGGKYSQILFLRYYDGKTLKEISAEQHTDYNQICRIHGAALRAFAIKHNDLQQNTVNTN